MSVSVYEAWHPNKKFPATAPSLVATPDRLASGANACADDLIGAVSMSITLSDIGRLMGVSYTTISRAVAEISA